MVYNNVKDKWKMFGAVACLKSVLTEWIEMENQKWINI